MSRVDFKADLLAFHAASPQRQMEVSLAFDQLVEALDTLARFGHVLTVKRAEVTSYSGTEYPKTMYHDELAPAGKLFHTEAELPTEPGWRPTPREGGEVDGTDGAKSESEVDAPSAEEEARYPKKLYHEQSPGGVSVQNAAQERDFLARGYTTTPPSDAERGFNPGSGAKELEQAPVRQGQLGGKTDTAARPPVGPAGGGKSPDKKDPKPEAKQTDGKSAGKTGDK